MNWTIQSIDPIGNILELWDGKSYTAPGKKTNERATAWYWVPDTGEFNVGDEVNIIIRKINKEPEANDNED